MCLQIIGNLIYYRYVNSAIVAPDAFDIIDVGMVKGLTNDQRRNLGSIAKILQFAASNKGVSSSSCSSGGGGGGGAGSSSTLCFKKIHVTTSSIT